ncbi:MAG: glycosyltransferase family 4 protein [Bacteroidota bacterium]
MRVLILTDGIFPFVIGGMQKHTHYMAKFFLQKGVDLTIYHGLVDKDIPENMHEQLEQQVNSSHVGKLASKCFKFPRIKLKVPGHYVLESYLYSKLLYKELIKEEPFDFIYVKGFSGWYSILHKQKLPKIGVQFHGLEMFQPASSFGDLLAKFSLRLPVRYNLKHADYIFSYGGKIKKLHLELGCAESKIKIQHGGIDNSLLIAEDKIENKHDRRHFLFIGRNERRKGYTELKAAILRIIEKYDFRFSFIGDINPADQIVSDKIVYYGTISDVKKYYQIIDQHDVIVVPSISEGLPTVIIESMARGLTVIATNVGAVEGAVNSENGFLIEAGNIDHIEKSLIKVIEMPEQDLLNKKRKALKMITDHFNWEKLSDDLLNFIKMVK